ncbi:craniofacial development protein 2 [Biomphalaria pfeifferi]|uniref:Craniofacial development protein 2 n=1 Tax=Biomphalaria pfeifferi TaxID=112525 RepID=A0AAD8C545_BIOPF|nr:craniofacial development protein 2 [Biomphalaria pfeifferi]
MCVLSKSEVREHGVGFAVKSTLLNTVELKCNGSERLLSLRLNTSIGHLTLISAYAPTLSSTPEAKQIARPQSDESKMCHPDLQIQFAESFERD